MTFGDMVGNVITFCIHPDPLRFSLETRSHYLSIESEEIFLVAVFLPAKCTTCMAMVQPLMSMHI